MFYSLSRCNPSIWQSLTELDSYLPKQITEILQSYIWERFCRMKYEEAYSEMKQIKVEVSGGSVLGPVVYLLYTFDVPRLENNTVAMFAGDIAINWK